MPTVYVNIGSNIGNRRSMLERAVACIRERWNGVTLSSVIESEPWGYKSANLFLNIGVAFEALPGETPIQVHQTLQAIQHSISAANHRTASGGYADRAVDIDLIAIDNAVVNTPGLTLPHPRMHLRRFVLEPMAQLAPRWEHPILHLTAVRMLSKCCVD